MAHLDELNNKYKDKGLVVLAVTNEGRNLVDKFIESTGATHPILIEGSDTTADWGVKGFPSSYLIDPDGKIIWSGHPASLPENLIEENLRRVRLAPELPKSLSAVAKDIEKSKFNDALKKLGTEIEGDKLSREDKTIAEETRTWLVAKGEGWITSADAATTAGDYFSAADALERAAEAFKGHDIADRAEAKLKELLSDADRKKEVDAGKALASGRERAGKMKDKQAAALFKALAAKYKGTKAAEKMEALAQKYDK